MTTTGWEEAANSAAGVATSTATSADLSRMGNPPPAGNALTQRLLVHNQAPRGRVRSGGPPSTCEAPNRSKHDVREAFMTTRFRRAAGLILAAALAVPAGTAAARPRPAPVEDDEARIVHALNRLTFGPRPGDAEAGQRIGLQGWISRQLTPER